jgi:hypothetical protein
MVSYSYKQQYCQSHPKKIKIPLHLPVLAVWPEGVKRATECGLIETNLKVTNVTDSVNF